MKARKYQFMESNQQRRAAGLKDKMPDIQKTLDTVKFLKTRKVYTTHAFFPPWRLGLTMSTAGFGSNRSYL